MSHISIFMALISCLVIDKPVCLAYIIGISSGLMVLSVDVSNKVDRVMFLMNCSSVCAYDICSKSSLQMLLDLICVLSLPLLVVFVAKGI